MKALLLLAALALPTAAQEQPWSSLHDGKTLNNWKPAPLPNAGKVTVEDGAIILHRGRMTGIVFTGQFPRVNYEIRFDAARLEGRDYFAGLTFPIHDAHCTFIAGGWDGATVGLSNVDDYDASENETSAARHFESGRWYSFHIRVTTTRIQASIDGDTIVDLDTTRRHFSLPFGDTDLTTPLGFTSYGTRAGLRNIQWRPITPNDIRK